MSEPIRPIEPLSTEHAFRHPMKPGGRESLAHMLVLPELGLAGFIYPSILADGHGKGRASLFGPGLPETISEQVEVEVPASANFDNLQIGPLHMAVREPHKTVDLAWNGTRIQFEGRFEATHPVYAFSQHPLGNPKYYGDDRTEQHGRIRGHLTIDGKRHPIDGLMIRDHSWGPRIWGLNQHYKWFHATTGDTSIHFFEMDSFGRRQVRGFLYRDGLIQNIESVSNDFEFDDQMRQQNFRSTVVDAAGRKARVECKLLGMTQVSFDPKTYLNTGGVTLNIDGVQGIGWCEFCWNKDYFDFAKDYVTQYG
jgi:hypothetical protein